MGDKEECQSYFGQTYPQAGHKEGLKKNDPFFYMLRGGKERIQKDGRWWERGTTEHQK